MMCAGLMCDNLQQDRWFERLWDELAEGAGEDCAPIQCENWELTDKELRQLQENAKRLATGHNLRVRTADSRSWRHTNEHDFKHGDYEFFKKRAGT